MSWAGAAGKRNAGCHCLIGRRLGGYLLADTYHKLHFLHLHSIAAAGLAPGKGRQDGGSSTLALPCFSPPTSSPQEPPCSSPVPPKLPVYLPGLGANFPKEATRFPIDAFHHHGSSNQAAGSSQGPQSSPMTLQPLMQDKSFLQDHPEQNTKQPTGHLDTQPMAAALQIPSGSIMRASQCISASDAGTCRGPLSPPPCGHSLSPTSEKWPSVIMQKAPLELYQ